MHLHQPAAPAREALAVDFHEVDIGGRERHAFFQNAPRLVDYRQDDYIGDISLVPHPLRPADCLFGDDRRHDFGGFGVRSHGW